MPLEAGGWFAIAESEQLRKPWYRPIHRRCCRSYHLQLSPEYVGVQINGWFASRRWLSRADREIRQVGVSLRCDLQVGPRMHEFERLGRIMAEDRGVRRRGNGQSSRRWRRWRCGRNYNRVDLRPTADKGATTCPDDEHFSSMGFEYLAPASGLGPRPCDKGVSGC